MIVAVALSGWRRTLDEIIMPSALLSWPRNVSEGSEIPSSMIWMNTACIESPVKFRSLEVPVWSKPAKNEQMIYTLCTIITVLVGYIHVYIPFALDASVVNKMVTVASKHPCKTPMVKLTSLPSKVVRFVLRKPITATARIKIDL